jgi:UDP-glucose 4-epimerase
VKRVFYSSSSEVYGEPVEFPQNENTTPLNSRLPYAVVKNLGESYLKSYKQEFDLNYTIFRFFNTYGPKQSKEFVVSRFLNQALKNEDITIYGDGSQTRTFCYINDNIDACYNTIGNPEFANDVINIGGNEEITILELAKTIKLVTGSTSSIVYLPPLAEGDMTRRLPDVTKMNLLLNRPKTSLEEGLKKILENRRFIID